RIASPKIGSPPPLVRQYGVCWSSRPPASLVFEAFGDHREKCTKSYTRGTRKLLSAQRQLRGYPIDRLPQAIYTERAAILRHPAFQAGCRGFESRPPLKTCRFTIGKMHDILGSHAVGTLMPEVKTRVGLRPRNELVCGERPGGLLPVFASPRK